MTPSVQPNQVPKANQQTSKPALLHELGLFDATMLVMGGIIGAGIFINPYVVAQRLHTPALILGAWGAGEWLRPSMGTSLWPLMRICKRSM